MSNNIITENSLIHELILNFYLCSRDLHLSNDVANALSWDMQQKFLLATVQSDRLKLYPMRKDFVKLFFKKIVDFLLVHNQEIHDDFYSQLCSSMIVHNGPETNSFYYRHYVVDKNLDEVITMKETNKIVVNGTTGMKTWEAAIMLADWSLRNKEVFTDKNILELGSGVGLTGIIIAKYCKPKTILLTDVHHDVLNTIMCNVSINFPNIDKIEVNDRVIFKDSRKSIEISKLDWTRLEESSKDDIPDVIIGADIVYDPTIFTPLCNVFKEFFRRNKNLVIYIESVIRNEHTFDRFITLLRSQEYQVEEKQQLMPKFLQWDDKIIKKLIKISL